MNHCTDDRMRFIFILQEYNQNAMEIICDFIQQGQVTQLGGICPSLNITFGMKRVNNETI